jgi:F0F1-type ATP synthase membrane subunit b/b'
MDPTTPQIDDIVLFAGQIATAILAIAGALMLLGKLVWGRLSKRLDSIEAKMDKHLDEVDERIDKQVAEIKIELKPNGGSSLRDAVNRIEKDQRELKSDIRELREKIDDHIQWHLDN